MIYGLHTRDLPRHLMGKMEIYMFKQIRTAINPNWKTEARYPEKPTLPRTTTIDGEIMARQNANNDNADADARQPNDTSMGVQRDAPAKNQATRTVEAAKSRHH